MYSSQRQPRPGSAKNEERQFNSEYVAQGALRDVSILGSIQKPRSRPISSFMISFEPAQILVTRASIHARATRYSVM